MPQTVRSLFFKLMFFSTWSQHGIGTLSSSPCYRMLGGVEVLFGNKWCQEQCWWRDITKTSFQCHDGLSDSRIVQWDWQPHLPAPPKLPGQGETVPEAARRGCGPHQKPHPSSGRQTGSFLFLLWQTLLPFTLITSFIDLFLFLSPPSSSPLLFLNTVFLFTEKRVIFKISSCYDGQLAGLSVATLKHHSHFQ